MNELNITNSSNLQKAKYDDQNRELIVEFTNGTSYKYFEVPQTLWERFVVTVQKNGSAGKFFNENIKKDFSCEKIEE